MQEPVKRKNSDLCIFVTLISKLHIFFSLKAAHLVYNSNVEMWIPSFIFPEISACMFYVFYLVHSHDVKIN